MVKKTPEDIQRKRDKQLQDVIKRKDYEFQRKVNELRVQIKERTDLEIERQMAKLEKKMNAYINKKRVEYDHKCKNEIRKLEWKKEKEYKQKPLSRNKKLQIALAIAQENARLRDTDKDWHGHCISCKFQGEYEDFAGGHGIGRTVQWVCLRESNINAQCHTCNDIMRPGFWNRLLTMQTEARYRENARRKRWDEEIDYLQENAKKSIQNPKKHSPTDGYICDLIPELIRKNEELRKQKSPEFRATHKPSKNRRGIYEKYFTPKERWIWD